MKQSARIYVVLSLFAGASGLIACGDNEKGGGGDYGVRLSLQTIETVSAGVDNNPEIVRMIPGTTNKAVFVASGVNKLGSVTYDATGLTIDQLSQVPASQFDTGRAFSELTSITVDPAGQYLAVLRLDTRCPTSADAGAAYVRGSVMFVDVAPPHAILADVEIGFAPDSVYISGDGNWAVVANEADPERSGEDANACLAPNQGSISIIDLSAGVASATLVQDITSLTPDAQLPEGVKIAPDNDTVVVAFQTSDEIALFRLSDVPNATLTHIDLPADAGPDGLAIAPDGSFALISNEVGDSFSFLGLPAGNVINTYSIRGSGDVPERYNRDDRGSTKKHEPEECAIMAVAERLYAVFALQESHAVIAYDITDPMAPAFEDITEVGIDWAAEANGRGKSDIGPEGLAARDGLILVASEREGSLSLVQASVE